VVTITIRLRFDFQRNRIEWETNGSRIL